MGNNSLMMAVGSVPTPEQSDIIEQLIVKAAQSMIRMITENGINPDYDHYTASYMFRNSKAPYTSGRHAYQLKMECINGELNIRLEYGIFSYVHNSNGERDETFISARGQDYRSDIRYLYSINTDEICHVIKGIISKMYSAINKED